MKLSKPQIHVLIFGAVLVAILFASIYATAEDITPVRVDDLRGKGIEITAVEFIATPKFQCEVFYWFPQDEDFNGKIEACQDLAYNPCIANDGDRVIVEHVLSGGDCEPEPICDGFSPIDPRCPQ